LFICAKFERKIKLEDTKMKKLLNPGLIIALAILIVGIIFVNKWYSVKDRELRIREETQFQQENDKNLQSAAEEQKQQDLEGCLSRVEKNYQERIKLNSEPVEGNSGTTRIDVDTRDSIIKVFDTEKDLCVKTYK
jgi:uncharacterized protein HemX